MKKFDGNFVAAGWSCKEKKFDESTFFNEKAVGRLYSLHFLFSSLNLNG